MDKLKSVTLLYDGDIFAYRASSATDGRQYAVTWVDTEDIEHEEYFKYKKDADLKAAEVEGTVKLSYIPEPESHALHIIKQLVAQTQHDLSQYMEGPAEGQEFYLTNKGSFREKMNPEYKANRKDLRRPEHLFSCKQYIVNKYGGICRPGEYEADDLLAIRMTEIQAAGGTPICISIDKDLKQVPGYHFDFVKKELLYVEETEGLRSFYRQLLTGDPTDGIIGIKGMGPKTASKRIDHLSSPFQMYVVTLKEWLKAFPQGPDEDPIDYMARVVSQVNMNAKMLYLLRSYEDEWKEPDEEIS